MAFTVFLGIWAKLTYFWLLPGIGILFLALLLDGKKLPSERNSEFGIRNSELPHA
jgi:hypothetical protein